MDNYSLNEFYATDFATLCWPEDALRRDNETPINSINNSLRMAFSDTLHGSPYRHMESPTLTKDRTAVTMETLSNQSYDGTRTLPLLDDYRIDEKDISSNLGSPMNSTDWNNPSRPRLGSGKRSLAEKGRPGKCKVCGDVASGMYFGALVCVPCKTFFLRYEGDNFSFVCKGNKDCEITMATRTQCKYCRYQKCRDAGMVRRVRPAHVNLNEGQQLCVVCHDVANGIHFGAVTCEGCKKFFRRGLSEHAQYSCKNGQNCVINPRTRNSCRFCRYKMCLSVGMSREAIQMGRPSKLAMESNGIQRGLRTMMGNSGPVRADQLQSGRHLGPSGVRLKEIPTHYLMPNHLPKEEPPTWDWHMDQTVISHPYHPDISNFAGQMAGVCDLFESPTKRVGVDGYSSPHLGSGILTPSCSSTGGDRHSSNSCLSMMSSASPEALHYGNGVWAELAVEASRPSPVQPVSLNSLYHSSGGSVHQMTASSYQPGATTGQEILSNHALSKVYHEKANIPLSANGNAAEALHFSANPLQQPSLKLGHFDMQQPAKMGQFDPSASSKVEHYNNRPSRYRDVKDVLDSLMDDQCPARELVGGYNQHDRFALKYDPAGSFFSPEQHQMNEKNRSASETNALFAYGHGHPDGKKMETDFVTLTSVDDVGMCLTANRPSQVGKLNDGSCFTGNNDVPSSSTPLGVPQSSPGSAGYQQFDGAAMNEPSGNGKPSLMKCSISPQTCGSDVSTASAPSTGTGRDDAVVPLVTMSSQTKTNVDSIAEWVYQLQQSYVDSNEDEEQMDCLSEDLMKICRGLYIDGVSFEQQINNSIEYWKSQELPDENIMVGAEHWKLFNHFHPLYANYVSVGSTCNHNLRTKFEQWQSSDREATADETSDWVKENVFPVYKDLSCTYFSQIQGFKSFDIEDQRILLRLAQSQSRILAAALAWFDPDSQNFTDFLPWRETKAGQVDLFKEHLVEYARNIQGRNLDPVESALFNIVVVIATDYPGLVRPDIIERYRTQFLATFRAYTTAKYGTPNKRMEKLFQLVPQLRRLGHLHYAMTQSPCIGMTTVSRDSNKI